PLRPSLTSTQPFSLSGLPRATANAMRALSGLKVALPNCWNSMLLGGVMSCAALDALLRLTTLMPLRLQCVATSCSLGERLSMQMKPDAFSVNSAFVLRLATSTDHKL